MARPQKCGMDYFPHDTDALTDEKIEALRMLYGNDGYAFYFILLERIYRTEQFELDISDAETIQILSRKISVTEEQFNKMLCTALKRNCFDNEIYNDRKCLTSTGIKKRADVVISKRTASKKSYEKSISATETTQETNTETLQKVHKGKEIKEKEKKENKVFIPPTLEEIQAYINEMGYIINAKDFYVYYNNLEWKNKDGKQVANWKNTTMTWNNRELKDKPQQTLKGVATAANNLTQTIDEWK